MYGFEADKHLFRCLVSSMEFMSEGRNSNKDGQQLQLLIQEANSLITKPNFVTMLCHAFEKQEANRVSPTSSAYTVEEEQSVFVSMDRLHHLIDVTDG